MNFENLLVQGKKYLVKDPNYGKREAEFTGKITIKDKEEDTLFCLNDGKVGYLDFHINQIQEINLEIKKDKWYYICFIDEFNSDSTYFGLAKAVGEKFKQDGENLHVFKLFNLFNEEPESDNKYYFPDYSVFELEYNEYEIGKDYYIEYEDSNAPDYSYFKGKAQFTGVIDNIDGIVYGFRLWKQIGICFFPASSIISKLETV